MFNFSLIFRSTWIGAAAFLGVQSVQAETVMFVPRVETGVSQYTFELKDAPLPGGARASTNAQTMAPVIRLGGTIITGSVYIDAYYHVTAEAKDDLSYADLGVSESSQGERKEFNAAIGYQVGSGLSVFAGYRQSETDTSGDLGTTSKFGHNGVFVGAAYSLSLNDSTSLTANAGYANLDASFENLFLGQIPVDDSGSGDGFKAGVASKTLLSDSWALTLSADYLTFQYDMENPAADYEFEEKDIQFRLGLSYSF